MFHGLLLKCVIIWQRDGLLSQDHHFKCSTSEITWNKIFTFLHVCINGKWHDKSIFWLTGGSRLIINTTMRSFLSFTQTQGDTEAWRINGKKNFKRRLKRKRKLTSTDVWDTLVFWTIRSQNIWTRTILSTAFAKLNIVYQSPQDPSSSNICKTGMKISTEPVCSGFTKHTKFTLNCYF